MSACFIFDQANAMAEDWHKAKQAGQEEFADRLYRRWELKRYEAIHYWDKDSIFFGARCYLPFEQREQKMKEEIEKRNELH